ncbi:uncharacterized protein LOC117582838 [Drosophila guanche]|uniref:Uncharacterized protein n=1 Tax=Drosophila guanche TaxID=7266 RepID=A0A3B0K3M8_DROGU|nr:uncharacterized protein LOC117582838 [Drosophila guanche]SPP80226.1 Hypothetical predicted protein [Drosophila guanche]
MLLQMWCLLALGLCLGVLESQALLNHETETIEKCIKNYGGLTPETAERLERFKEWSDGYEEIPCFTQCYLSEMFDFYDNRTGFDEGGVVQLFGRPVYNACRQRLELSAGRSESSCEHAYAGFHCITNLEGHPFMQIESMPNISESTKTAMKDCLQLVHRDEWSRFQAYPDFPVNEPIPCFTRCFISKLHLFDERTRRWQLPTMRRHLAVPAQGAQVAACHQRRGRNQCSTIYQQFTCYVMAV